MNEQENFEDLVQAATSAIDAMQGDDVDRAMDYAYREIKRLREENGRLEAQLCRAREACLFMQIINAGDIVGLVLRPSDCDPRDWLRNMDETLSSTAPCPHAKEAKRLREAVGWACENGNFNQMVHPGDMGDRANYANNEWWKAELRRRAKEGR